MKHFIQKIILFALMFILSFLPTYAGEALKINGLVFDNSDNLVYLDTDGIMDETVTFSRGFLTNPNRIYLDINNAILTTPKKTFNAKYSNFNNIKISQFSTEPNTVRMVFEYGEKFIPSSFAIYKTKNAIFIKTGKEMVSNSRYTTAYSNLKTDERNPFYKGAKFEEATDFIQEIFNQNQSKIASKYYIDSITKTKNGVVISGLGRLNLIPVFTLTEPDRLILDLDDTVVNPELRNKTFTIGEIKDTVINNFNEASLNERDTVRIGQNSQNIARIVIQGENAKNYRAIISPDSKSLFITEKTNIIPSKIADSNVLLTKSTYSNLKGLEVITLNFSDSITFCAFEDNINLYIDILNINTFDDSIIEPITRARPDIKTTRLALDKLRITIPKGIQKKYFSVKTSPDNDEIRIFSKLALQYSSIKKDISVSITPKIDPKEKQPEISNLFTVVIDAGHGGNDVGATRNNIYEKDITLKISKMLAKELNKRNIKTYMVRDKDKTVSLSERSNYSNEIKPDLFVSVHVNSSTNDEIYGIETHWYKEDSRRYAEYIHKEMSKKTKDWKTIDRGLFKSQFYVINHTEAPAILCEIGFISNNSERKEIIETTRQEEIAEAIANGIYNYLKARK